jgi:hypothetical protein
MPVNYEAIYYELFLHPLSKPRRFHHLLSDLNSKNSVGCNVAVIRITSQVPTALSCCHHHHHMALQPNSGPGLPLWGFVTITFLQGWIVSPAPNPQPRPPYLWLPETETASFFVAVIGDPGGRVVSIMLRSALVLNITVLPNDRCTERTPPQVMFLICDYMHCHSIAWTEP